MAQIIDPLPPDQSDTIVCCYINHTSKIQIARITNIPNWYFERVVFPGQHLVFEALTNAQLEIHTGMMASAILSDKIPCLRLKIDEGPTAFQSTSNPAMEDLEHRSQPSEIVPQKSSAVVSSPVSAGQTTEAQVERSSQVGSNLTMPLSMA